MKFNVEPTEEDKRITLKKGYELVVARLRKESKIHNEESAALDET